MPGLNGVTELSTGGLAAIAPGGSVECRCSSGFGALGAPDSLDCSLEPLSVAGITGATAVAAGTSHTCAIT